MGYPGRIRSLKNEHKSFEQSHVNIINHRPQSAYVQAEFGTSEKFMMTKVLIDTGADYNVMDSRFLTKLRQNGIKCKLLKPKRRPPVAANNQPLKLLGDCELDMKLTSTNCNSTILRKVRYLEVYRFQEYTEWTSFPGLGNVFSVKWSIYNLLKSVSYQVHNHLIISKVDY